LFADYVENRLAEIKKRVYCREDITAAKQVQLSRSTYVTCDFCMFTIRYDTIEEFNVDSKAEYTA